MRLINTKTGLLEEFIGDDIPEYAILSHTWEKDEISLQEFQHLTDPDFANDPKTLAGKAKAGFIKIKGCIELAESKGIQYVWVDTCCIDKSSSADLTESINSMYRWYANSKVCFAYLVDVEFGGKIDGSWRWMKSRWFTRGWTLQELIAPPEVEFYRRSWDLVGTKGGSWSPSLSILTGIPKNVLETNDLSSACVAQKMSWASHRRTTRKEDMAYCLLGLFNVNMPLLYGEGEKAFLRLQEHIAAASTDHSLFAWGGMFYGSADETIYNVRSYRSIFARSPADFGECGELKEGVIVQPDAWTQTNRGFHAVFPTIPSVVAKQLVDESGKLPEYNDDKDYLVILNCQLDTAKGEHCVTGVIGIWISLIDARDDGKHGFCRVTDFTTLEFLEDVSKLLNSSRDKFRKDLWFATGTIQVPHDYFSKRLAGFLIPTPEDSSFFGSEYSSFKIHLLYGTSFSGGMNLVSCPLLPLDTSGGLVGLVTVKCLHGSNLKEDLGIIFGYPPGLTKPFAMIIPFFNPKAPLQFDFQSFVTRMLDKDENGDDNIPLAFKNGTFVIDVSLRTVLHKDMLFTQLDIYLG